METYCASNYFAIILNTFLLFSSFSSLVLLSKTLMVSAYILIWQFFLSVYFSIKFSSNVSADFESSCATWEVF